MMSSWRTCIQHMHTEADAHDELLADFVGELDAIHESHKRVDTLALDGVLVAHHGRLRALVVEHQRTLNFCRTDAVARHIDHVIHAPRYPVVAIGCSTIVLNTAADECAKAGGSQDVTCMHAG
jgi:hypothetical protein